MTSIGGLNFWMVNENYLLTEASHEDRPADFELDFRRI